MSGRRHAAGGKRPRRSRDPAPPPQAQGPRTERIESLDVLRGVAVLGIFMVNVQAFAMSPYGYGNPTLEADFGPAGQAIWTVIVALFQMKFITIFSALFGAGIVLMAGDGSDPGRDLLHLRRMGWLLLIGVIHAFGFWYGDILMAYALAGLLLTGVRAFSVRRLAVTGVALALLTSVMIALANSSAAFMDAAEYAELVEGGWAPPPDVIAELQGQFRTPWPGRIAVLANLTLERQIEQLLYYGPRFLGVMMVGMALQKSGFFTGGWPTSRYWIAAACAPVGALLSWIGARMQIAADLDLLGSAPAQTLEFLVSLPQALGYGALVVLACRPKALELLRAPFAAVGRMALTCYLACTLVGWLVFYGAPGLGLIGAFSRIEQLQLVLWTWLGILVLAPLWLAVFAFGPVEWAWRSLTYQRLQPFLRRAL